MDMQMVSKTFKLFSVLQMQGKIQKDDCKLYFQDDQVRSLMSEFAGEIDCVLISDADYLYLIPLTIKSEFHMSNERIKRDYFPSRALNIDIYLMYVAMIVCIGEFYDSYQRTKPTRDFITLHDWLVSVDERIQGLKRLGEEALKEKEDLYDYHWIDIIRNWDAMDTIKEGIKRQTIRTASRLSFIKIVANFMTDQELIKEIGDGEYILTQKCMAITENYYMDYEYNRGIIEFMYQFEEEVE